MLCTGSQVQRPSSVSCHAASSPGDRRREPPVSDYLPIPCALHSALELAVLSGRRLRVNLAPDPSERPARTVVLRPLDLSVSQGAEWLDALDADGRRLRLRLDRIIDAEQCA